MRVPLCRWRGVLTGISVVLWVTMTHADGKPVDEIIDADFLEYLGSVETKEDNWTDIEEKRVEKNKRINQDQTATSAAQQPKQSSGEDQP